MDAGGLGRCRNVNGREHHTVDDVDDAVGCLHVGSGDVGVADTHGTAVERELDFIAVEGGGEHVVGKSGGRNHTVHHVMEKNGSEQGLFLGGIKLCEINSSVGKRLVGGVRKQ